jgi:hypothetical protein
MLIISRYTFIVLIFCLTVDSRFFHRPLILDDEFMAMLESTIYDDDRQLDLNSFKKTNNEDRGRVLKTTFYPNFHLPRYLRDIH